MKNMKKPAILWGIAGIVISLCTLIAAVYGMNGSLAIHVDTDAILTAAEQTMDTACSGDFEALGPLLAGAPDLGAAPENSGDAQGKIWQAYLDSIEYQLGKHCYADSNTVALDVQLSCLNISAVMASLQEAVPDMLTENTAASHEVTLLSATEQILAAPPTMERTLTLHFARSGGSWKVLPTEALLQFLSGFVSE